MKAIILAAGKGSRLLPITNKIPKSLIEFGNTSILEKLIRNLRECGISDISVVVGHNANKINLLNIKKFENKNYENTNMLYSLFCAEKEIDESVIISYADIIFEKQILEKLIAINEDISIVVDTKWLNYWKFRIENPLDDASETVIMDSNKYGISIGQEVNDVNQVDGHFIGLMKVQKEGIKKFKDLYHKSKMISNDNYNPLNKNCLFKNSRLVDLIHKLIVEGNKVKVVETKNGWLEFDTLKDYEIYNNLKEKNLLKDIIRLE